MINMKQVLLCLAFVAEGTITLAQTTPEPAFSTTNTPTVEVNRRNTLGFSIGAAVNYYYGLTDRNFGDFSDERVNWQLNGMLGLALAQDRNGNRTMLAAFGTYGFNNANTLRQIFDDQGYTSAAVSQNDINNSYSLEGGIIIAELIRVSTGIGQQNFDEQSLVHSGGDVRTGEKSLRYNSTTVGFQFNFNSLGLNINCNFASGRDFERTIITPSAGLLLRL